MSAPVDVLAVLGGCDAALHAANIGAPAADEIAAAIDAVRELRGALADLVSAEFECPQMQDQLAASLRWAHAVQRGQAALLATSPAPDLRNHPEEACPYIDATALPRIELKPAVAALVESFPIAAIARELRARLGADFMAALSSVEKPELSANSGFDGDSAAAIRKLVEEVQRAADAHEYFAANGDLRMTTGDHANRARKLRAALTHCGGAK